MSRHLAALIVVAFFASGCCCVDRVYRPTSCGNGWDPMLGSCHGSGGWGDDCTGHTPCQALRHRLTCGSGCGEIYWGEWLSDPPDECDPCDGCGNWVGPRCCPPRWWQALTCGSSGFWGGRYGEGTCCENGSGCSSCGTHSSSIGAEEYLDGNVVPSHPAEKNRVAPNRKSSPTEANPEEAPKPMPDAAVRSHNHRRSLATPLLLPSTRSSRTPIQPTTHGKPIRSRSL